MFLSRTNHGSFLRVYGKQDWESESFMPKSFSKFFSAPLFEHQKRSDQAKLLNRLLMAAIVVLLVTMAISFALGAARNGVFQAIMIVYLLANKSLLQMKRYLGAAWVFLIGITLVNFVFGGMFPDSPLLAITLPLLIVSAVLLINLKAALLMLIINLVGFAAFVQPVWGGGVENLASLGGTVLASVIVMFMVDRYVGFKEKHLDTLQGLSSQLEQDYETTMDELARTKDALMREHEKRKELDTKPIQTPSSMDSSAHRFNPQTGIMTQEAVKNILEGEIARTRRYQRPLSLLCIKVDDFEYILQETEVDGEKLLSALCDMFLEALRREDLVGHSGEDGFYIILPETGRYASYVVGERLRHLVEVMTLAEFSDVNVTVSVGITAFQDQSKMSPDRFLQQADEAVAAAEDHGGNWTISWHDLSHSASPV